ncbi:MAG: hypothetical protein IJP30_02550 [Clostridia bacterium]|nr:hypothetical protein [Clostridia bacterium]
MKKRIAAILLVLVLLTAAACKPAANAPAPTPTPTFVQAFSDKKGDSPLTKALVAFIGEKDTQLGEMMMHMESSIDRTNDDRLSALPLTIQIPFTEVDGILSEVLMLSYYMTMQDDSSYRYENAQTGEKALLTMLGGAWQYTGWIGSDSASAAQTGVVSSSGDQITLTVCEQKELPVIRLQLEMAAGALGTRVRCAYSTDQGDTYQFLAFSLDTGSFRFAIYEDIDPLNELFWGDIWLSSFFPEGAQTAGTWNGSTVTLINNGMTYTF